VSDRAIFTLLKPVSIVQDGATIEVQGVEMRALDTADLPLLDKFRDQPIALAENVIAALCDLAVDQVRQLDLEDFTMLASDALFQVEEAGVAMGLPPGFFLGPRSDMVER
jgi:hypothetical protein